MKGVIPKAEWDKSRERRCPNCNGVLLQGGHFLPPSLGEPGYFICAAQTGKRVLSGSEIEGETLVTNDA
jgi:hypothetical protein